MLVESQRGHLRAASAWGILASLALSDIDTPGPGQEVAPPAATWCGGGAEEGAAAGCGRG